MRNGATMEIYQLRSFAAVAEVGHLTRAAERLHISQPALSSQIKALEDELGLALFERTPVGMALTSAGRRLLTQAQSVLSAAQALRHEAGALRGEIAGTVRIGTLADPEFIRLGELLSLTTQKHPLIRIELQHEISGAAFQAVSAGELDGSFYYGETTHPSINRFPLREIAYRIAAPSAWASRSPRQAGRKSLRYPGSSRRRSAPTRRWRPRCSASTACSLRNSSRRTTKRW
jgi:DNA-binding transcriptional LysR family regulator